MSNADNDSTERQAPEDEPRSSITLRPITLTEGAKVLFHMGLVVFTSFGFVAALNAVEASFALSAGLCALAFGSTVIVGRLLLKHSASLLLLPDHYKNVIR